MSRTDPETIRVKGVKVTTELIFFSVGVPGKPTYLVFGQFDQIYFLP